MVVNEARLLHLNVSCEFAVMLCDALCLFIYENDLDYRRFVGREVVR